MLKDAVKAAQDVVDQLEPVNTGSAEAEGDTTNIAAAVLAAVFVLKPSGSAVNG